MLILSPNPLADINKKINSAKNDARYFIMQNLGWSRSKFYEKMKAKKLTCEENEVIAEAFKKFIHEPFSTIFSPENFN